MSEIDYLETNTEWWEIHKAGYYSFYGVAEYRVRAGMLWCWGSGLGRTLDEACKRAVAHATRREQRLIMLNAASIEELGGLDFGTDDDRTHQD